jgi:dipeptidyl aminopeptidase/acylaminoacyl peptidase
VQSNTVTRVDKTLGYLSWHPSGRLLAFSANRLSLFFHTDGETRDVFDAKSHIGIYRLDSNVVVTPKVLALTHRNETWPSWAPDGRFLYFSSANPRPLEDHRKVRYDILRVSYDLESDQWGEPEMLISSEKTGLSATESRVSPDGRFLLFCLAKYGNFPIYQTSSDLYVMDLQTRVMRRLDINSDQADSWHGWAMNSRWIVFSTKRLDGLFARPFFSYVDAAGQFHKPFVLPQEDPAFYESFPKTFNAPELACGPVHVTEEQMAEAVLRPGRILTPKVDGPAEAHPATPDPPGYRQAE